MSTPSINYRDAIQVFLKIQGHEKDIYISHSLTTTNDKTESASYEEISVLAQIAIKGLKQQIQEKSESREKLQVQAQSVRDYLAKVKDNSEVQENTHKLFMDLFSEVEAEIKQLTSDDDFVNEQDLKTFSDADLTEIAKDPECNFHFPIYGIKSQKTKIRLAKIAAQQKGTQIFQYIHYWDIKNKVALIEIAKLTAQQDGAGISEYIQNYGITDRDALIEIAKLAAQNDGEGTSKYIQNYGFKNQGYFSEIFNLGAQQLGLGTMHNITGSASRDEDALIAIAKLAAQQNGWASRYIKNYGIKDQKELIEIAKLVANKDGRMGWEPLLQFIQDYGIKDQRALIDFAKLAAKEDARATSKYIQNCGIKDPRTLIEIAKLAAQQDAQGTSEWIQNYGIKKQKDLIEIAKIAARKGGVSHYIKNYRIRDKDALIEIAKLEAQSGGDGISYDIQNYGIRDQTTLIEIAKLAAQSSGRGTSRHIQNYGIKNPLTLIEIAKLAAQQDGQGTSEEIQKYGISDQKALIEIAKLAAQQSGWGTSLFIENYGIKNNSEALIEIAKLSARQDGSMSRHIKHFNITNQKALLEIAKLAAKSNGGETTVFFSRYGIENEADRLEIFLTAFKNVPFSSLTWIENYNLYFPPEVKKLTQNSSLDEVQKAFRWPEEFSPIFKELSQKAPTKEDILFLIYIGCKVIQKPSFLTDPKVWHSILLYKDNKMRYELADLVFVLDERQAKLYGEYSSPKFLQLPALIYCISSKNDEEIKGYHNVLKEKKEFLDGMLQKALLDALHPLIVQHHFKPEEIVRLLKMSVIGNIKANLFCIQGILYCGGVERLKKEAKSMTPDLDAAYQSIFRESIPIKPIEDFSIKYAKTFGKCALPTAPLTYAGRLHQLPKWQQEKALPVFGNYIYSVLEGDYPKNRYKKSDQLDKESDHLQIIFDKKPSLQKDWPLEVTKPIEEFLSDSSSKVVFDPQRFLIDKILSDKHLPRENFPLIYQFLETKDPGIAIQLSETFKKLAQSTSERKVQSVNLRNAVSSLADVEKQVGKDKTVKLLNALIKAKESLKESPEITRSLNGIEELAKLVKAKKQPKKLPEGTESAVTVDLATSDQEHAKHVQMFVDQFKKAATETRSQITAFDQEHQMLLLQKDLIDLYMNDKAPLSQQLSQLIKIQGKLGNSREEFVNDLKGVIEALGKREQSFEGHELELVNTDRFDLMLLCGTQVQGSCQRIDGDASFNKCLLAYLLDGKNRLIAIKDKEGNIVARSILRLLWDTNGNSPVLMQERIYSNVLNANLTDALDKFAKAEAERLGIALYRQDGGGSASLESFGSIAPWEYVDSAAGVHENGKFTVVKAVMAN